jgi:thiamine-monophosphate kinase
LCTESGVGAVIHANKLPISKESLFDFNKIKTEKEITDYALYGGEDYELVFTAGRDKLNKLKNMDVTVIGEVLDRKYGVNLIKDGKKQSLRGGFEHFCA